MKIKIILTPKFIEKHNKNYSDTTKCIGAMAIKKVVLPNVTISWGIWSGNIWFSGDNSTELTCRKLGDIILMAHRGRTFKKDQVVSLKIPEMYLKPRVIKENKD